ncbi:MAG: TonB-dependent receptor [Gemmatimonadetes bacterium]|nr:TonB-dependent receptor [Gemmatimonadota bacterium]MYA12735.1 TonB-dependent receptor [Gemmatimonadota bacterium]MYE69780.1 TonB-dependent receptor [Gemmatimonadota bacterium]MYJ69017.1 TonB-dependent receptor [Gemmatimonadota bacterium]
MGRRSVPGARRERRDNAGVFALSAALGAWSLRAALRVSLAVALVAPPGLLEAQEVTIRGRVVDAESGTGIEGAQVLVRAMQLRTLTDAEGRFELTLPDPDGQVRLVVAAGFYRTVEREIDPGAAVREPPTIALEKMLFELPGVTVTASRGNARPGEAPVSVSVIGRDELRSRDVTSLDEALPFAQGVTFNAGQMDIRGSSGIARGVGSRVLMLLDGHRALANVGSSIDFGLLPLLDIERIEIVKGPHSTLFGTNAMGGVVNVITRPPVDGTRTIVRGYYGIFDTPGERDFTEELLSMRGLQIQHSRQIGRAGTTVFVGREGSDGFRQNGGVERWRFRAKSVFGAETTSPWEVFLNWKHEEAEEFFTWLSPERPLEVEPSQLGDWKRDIALVLGMTATPVVTPALKLQIRPQVQHVRSQNYFHDNDDFHRSTRWGTDVQLSRFTGGRHSFTTGAEASYTEISSNFLEPTPTTTDLAFFLQDEIEISDRVRGTTGVRLDMHRASSAEDDFSINPKIGLVYEPSDRLSLRTSLSRGYRAPSVSEQYSSTVVFGFRVIPNLELRGESAWASELGATMSPRNWLWFDVGLFWSEYEELIEVSGAPGRVLTFQFRNVAEARVRGIDAGAKVAIIPEKLTLQTTYLYLDTEDKRTGRPLVYRSDHNLTTTLSAWAERLALDLRYRSRADQVLAFPLDERGDITLVDLRMGTTLMDVDVQAKVENLLQAEYVDVQERNPGATRSFRITLTSRF